MASPSKGPMGRSTRLNLFTATAPAADPTNAGIGGGAGVKVMSSSCRIRPVATRNGSCRRGDASQGPADRHERGDGKDHPAVALHGSREPDCSEVTVPLAQWAYKNGIRKVYTIVSDYAPGYDAEEYFIKTFKGLGGQIVGSDRTPQQETDFGEYMEKVLRAKPDALFMFQPAGSPSIAFMKAYVERGLKSRHQAARQRRNPTTRYYRIPRTSSRHDHRVSLYRVQYQSRKHHA